MDVDKKKTIDYEGMKELLCVLRGQNIFIGVEPKDIQYEQIESITINDFLERVDLVMKMKKLQQFVEQNFKGEICEIFLSYAKYRISEEHKLSNIFGLIEEHKDSLGLLNYQVR